MNNPFHFCYSLLLGIMFLFSSCKEERKLPIYGVRDTKEVSKDQVLTVDTIYQTIPEFSFLNQDSVLISNAEFDQKIYIADFFFTSCTSICPVMHRHMKGLFKEFKSNPDVMFLSHTIDFKYDQPSVLKKYAQKLGVYDPKWQFVCGSKDSIYKIAEKSYLVAVQIDSNEHEGYIHQGFLVLIDKERRIRGAYDGTDPNQVENLRKDIPVLLEEYKK